jgi:DNA-binding IclR family transcriptional regulator
VLLAIAHDPGARLRDIAASLGITERTAHGIITDLTKAADIAHDGTNGSGQPGPFWPEFLPGSGELQYRDRGGREL